MTPTSAIAPPSPPGYRRTRGRAERPDYWFTAQPLTTKNSASFGIVSLAPDVIAYGEAARCVTCHAGPNFTDENFHNTGVAFRDGKLLDDGAGDGKFKVPTLREVARTAPDMHDGSLATLDDVVDYYDRGGNENPNLDPDLHPLHLSPDEKQSLVAFLRTLSGSVLEGER